MPPELPFELLPEILEHLPRVHYLTRTALVNHAFYTSTIPKLYARASIYSWHREAKTRVIQLFWTLATCPRLARYVRRLEIRDFPKTQLTEETYKHIKQGLRNCIGLRSCTWTRDGSLTSDILLALLSAPLGDPAGLSESPRVMAHSLQELEINGHHSHLYDPMLLLEFKSLTRISIIMPTVEVVRVLEEWVRIVQGTLKSLSVICKMSPLVTDDILIRIAPCLKNLVSFHLTGCPKVTHKGIRAVLMENERGIMNIGLEGVSPRIDLAHFIPISHSMNILQNLHTITLSIPPPQFLSSSSLAGQATSSTASPNSIPIPSLSSLSPSQIAKTDYLSIYTQTVLALLSHSPHLEIFQIYSPHTFFESCAATSTLFRGLMRDHGERLRRISVHRMLIGIDVVRELCQGCRVMEEFFLVVEPGNLDGLADCIKLAPRLRTVHVNYPLEAYGQNGGASVLLFVEALRFIRRCQSTTLTQFGCNARVWHVNRKVIVHEDGEKECELHLGPYESQDIPEQFLVIRT